MSPGAFFRRPAVLLIAALCLLAGVMTVLGRLAGGPRGEPKAVALAGDTGAQATPALSPDGRRVAYSARGPSKDESFHIFVRALPGGAPRQLTEGAANDIGPVWSPNGASIAFLRLSGQHGECMVMPSDGGAIGSVADCGAGAGADPAQPLPALAWTRDGQSLVAVQAQGKQLPALAVIPLRGGAPRSLSRPPDGVEGDTTPAVSPDGNAVAFMRVTSEGGDIWLCDPSGGSLRRLTFDDRPIRGIAWTPDGQELIYSAHRAGNWWLLRLPASGGSPREIRLSGKQAQYPALAGGGRLVYVDTPEVSAIWQARLGAGIEGAEEKPLIRSTGREFGPAFSPDGERIADVSDESGNEEIWTANRDGSHRAQITALAGRSCGRRVGRRTGARCSSTAAPSAIARCIPRPPIPFPGRSSRTGWRWEAVPLGRGTASRSFFRCAARSGGPIPMAAAHGPSSGIPAPTGRWNPSMAGTSSTVTARPSGAFRLRAGCRSRWSRPSAVFCGPSSSP